MNENLRQEFEDFWNSLLATKCVKDVSLNLDLEKLFLTFQAGACKHEISNFFESWLYALYTTNKINSKVDDDFRGLDDLDGEVSNFFDKAINALKLVLYKDNGDISDKMLNQIEDVVFTMNTTYSKVLSTIHFFGMRVAMDDRNDLENKVQDSLRKQKDELQSSIIDTVRMIDRKIVSTEQKIDDKIVVTERKIGDSLNTVQEKLNEQSHKNIEYSVTILSIFVGVVMAFFGGFQIATKSIDSMVKTTPYRLIFTILAFGMIIYNIVILLFFFNKQDNK